MATRLVVGDNGEREAYIDLEIIAEERLEEDKGNPSFEILEDFDLEKELEGVPGEAFIRGPETPEINVEYDDCWDYITERVETEELEEIGVINPHSNGRMPRTFVTGYFDSFDEAEIDGEPMNYVNVVEISYDESWEVSQVFADRYSPTELSRD